MRLERVLTIDPAMETSSMRTQGTRTTIDVAEKKGVGAPYRLG